MHIKITSLLLKTAPWLGRQKGSLEWTPTKGAEAALTARKAQGEAVSSTGHQASAVCSVHRAGLLMNSDTQKPEEGKAEHAYAGISWDGLHFMKQPSGQI